MFVESSAYHTLMHKAAYQVHLKFKLNNSELYCLIYLDYYLKTENKTIASVEGFVSWYTGNNRVKVYIYGYLKGLLNKGFIGQFEYIQRPGSRSIGISDTGILTLKEYDKHIPLIISKYPVHPHRIGLEHNPSFTEDPQEKYRKLSA